ncbi:MAG: hypothetical protein ACFFD9_09760, partial [Candidatus Thorarchaeota archaeon]
DLFLERIRDMILDNSSTLAQLEKFLQDEKVVREYKAILEASDIPFLPPFQMSLAHILLGKGQSCMETVEKVNAELVPLGITINCP